jgi:hypothetical protein
LSGKIAAETVISLKTFLLDVSPLVTIENALYLAMRNGVIARNAIPNLK